MKKLFAILFLASALVVLSHGPGKVVAGEDESATPASALRGNYADALHGSFALCLAPVSPFAEESCSTKGALVFPQSIVTADMLLMARTAVARQAPRPFPISLWTFPLRSSPYFRPLANRSTTTVTPEPGTLRLLRTSEVNATGQNSTALVRRSSVRATRILWLPTMESG